MKKLTLYVFFATSLFCLMLSVHSAYGQTASILESCAGVNFYYTLSEVPNSGGKQRVQIKVQNSNKFRVHVSFKFQAASAEGGTYISNTVAYGFNAGASGQPSSFDWEPFGQEDLNRKSYPTIVQIGLTGIDIRNVEKLGDEPGANSRGEKIGTGCGGKMITVSPTENVSVNSLNSSYYYEYYSGHYAKINVSNFAVKDGVITEIFRSNGCDPKAGASSCPTTERTTQFTPTETYTVALNSLDVNTITSGVIEGHVPLDTWVYVDCKSGLKCVKWDLERISDLTKELYVESEMVSYFRIGYPTPQDAEKAIRVLKKLLK